MPAKQTEPVRTTAVVREIDDRLIIPLPEEASAQLPSRGQVAVSAVISGHETSTVIEPDGRMGHWLDVDDELRQVLDLEADTAVDLTLTPVKAWPEPEVPEDLRSALDDADDLAGTWPSLTPMARWEWVRWIGATRNPDTRARRVEVSIDKLRNGSRRPCCFNLAACTDPELARSGKLRV